MSKSLFPSPKFLNRRDAALSWLSLCSRVESWGCRRFVGLPLGCRQLVEILCSLRPLFVGPRGMMIGLVHQLFESRGISLDALILESRGIGLVLKLLGVSFSTSSKLSKYGVSVVAKPDKTLMLLLANSSLSNSRCCALVVSKLVVVKLLASRSRCWQTCCRRTLGVALSLSANWLLLNSWRRRNCALVVVALAASLALGAGPLEIGEEQWKLPTLL